MEALIIGGIIGAVTAMIAYYRSWKKHKERLGYSYNEIATKWYLWDACVNCYYTDVEGNYSPPSKAMKSRYMDYEDFFRCPTEEKLRMLEQDFGVEKINK